MAEGQGPKSAYELAMERLRKKDEESGVTRQEVTPEQKAAIAEIRVTPDSSSFFRRRSMASSYADLGP